MKVRALAFVIVMALLWGCTVATPTPTAGPALITPSLTPTPTVTPTATATPTLTPTWTPTPTLFPMSIAAMRLRSYPGSDIVIVKELDPGANYRRYYAYYLSEGLKIYALLTVPDGDMPPGGWPAIVFNHGYIPPEVYRTTERYIAYVDSLARHGYIVFRIDYRGNDQSEGEARGAYGDPGYTVDVLNAVSSIERFPQANPEEIGMWGHSMGGFLTLRAMVISHDIKAGVIWSGVVGSYPEMLYNWHHRESTASITPQPAATSWRSGWLGTFGTPEQNPEFWNSISATSYLADLSGPLQLHHAPTDEEVPVAFSIRLAELGREAGHPVDLYIYDQDNHNLANNFSTAMARTIQFFDKYLK